MSRPGSGVAALGGTSRIETIRRFLEGDGTDSGDRALATLVELAAATFGVAIASIVLVDEERSTTIGETGMVPFDVASKTTLARATIAHGDVFVVPDVLRHHDRSQVTQALVRGARFFAGAPLRIADGSAIGTLVILDSSPRRLSARERDKLAAFASAATRTIEARLEAAAERAHRDELGAVLADVPSPIIATDAAGCVTSWNAAAERLFGRTFDEARAEMFVGIAPERHRSVAAGLRRVVRHGAVFKGVPSVGVTRDGRPFDIVISAAPRHDAYGNRIGATVIIEDVSVERRRAELERQRSDILELAATNTDVALVLGRLADLVAFALPSAICSVVRRDELGQPILHQGSRKPPSVRAKFVELASDARVPFMAFATFTMTELDAVGPDALEADLVAELRGAGFRTTWKQPVLDASETFLGAIFASVPFARAPYRDELRALHEASALAAIVIENYAARARLERLAHHDVLTGLPNRAFLERRLEEFSVATHRDGGGFALAMLDLDRFKTINDSLGHAIGDQLLIEVGNRIRSTIRTGDLVGRLAGDEFLIILRDITSRTAALTVVSKIVAALEQQFAPGGHEVFVRASVGIVLYPSDAVASSELLRRADAAMYAVKGNHCGIGFADAADDAATMQLELETDLNHAIERGELEVRFQPIVDIVGATSGVTGAAEALLRWHHPRLGSVKPDRFIPIAEQTGLIVPIGAWVLREACRTAQRWRNVGGFGVISVNVSARQFEDRNFVATVIDAVLEARIEPSQLWLEITESLIMRSPERAAATIADLRRFGVHSTIDDFGTGYSSFAYLKRFPIDGLKIDRAFVKDLTSPDAPDAGDRAIVASIVAIGAALGLKVVAEGAETVEQIDVLRALGCTMVQGYYFSEPMTADALLAWPSGLAQGVRPLPTGFGSSYAIASARAATSS